MKKWLIPLVVFSFLFPTRALPEVVRGIYGMPSIDQVEPASRQLIFQSATINTVFVPPDSKTISAYKNKQFNVFISVNAFGGKGAWEKYPDSRPVKANGALLGSGPNHKDLGGVCPTHPKWRQDRLEYIRSLVNMYGGKGGLDGIWLDFIRYPGLWEVEQPNIPDCCYCPRCIEKFQKDAGISMPEGINAKAAAQWIADHRPYEWMKWKKQQISSFVVQAREIIQNMSTEKPLMLGLFLVPWTKGERRNAVSYLLAQDAFQLSEIADVISPMVYHKMCGKSETWVGDMTRYYGETARCRVWPILQSFDCTPQEFRNVMKYAGAGGADGILVYAFKHMKPGHWPGYRLFQKPVNLIRNPGMKVSEGAQVPEGWQTGPVMADDSRVEKSRFLVKPAETLDRSRTDSRFLTLNNSIGIAAGNDRAGLWTSPLPVCNAGSEYVLDVDLYRDKWINSVYPDISVWGQSFRINTHWLSKTFQPIRLYIDCPDAPGDAAFRFINHNPGHTFWLRNPRLTKQAQINTDADTQRKPAFIQDGFFPIGVYGADEKNLEQIKKIAVNTVIIGGTGKTLKHRIEKCHAVGLRYVIAVPRDPDRLPVFLKEISSYVRPQDLAFYVYDEPGIHSFPVNRANDIQQLIRKAFPGATTCMAVVRPRVSRDYTAASDFFMLDQYPVPSMPMTWLSDSMDQAAEDVGRQRLASVIQAFGGKRWAPSGWPRLPTWQEMDCLAFLSVIHDSRAIFFFTFRQIGATEEGRQRLARVVGRLNQLYPWLVTPNLNQTVDVEMVSDMRVDPKGRPAVHCAVKKRGDQTLVIAVNSIGTYVEASIKCAPSSEGEVMEVFSNVWYPVIDGRVRVKFKPYETKAFLHQG